MKKRRSFSAQHMADPREVSFWGAVIVLLMILVIVSATWSGVNFIWRAANEHRCVRLPQKHTL